MADQVKMFNPDNYHALSKPFESPDEANEAIQAFIEDVRAARQKHRIADVLVAMQVDVRYGPDEEPCAARTSASLGHHGNAATLAAYTLGFYRAVQTEVQNKLEALGRRRGKKEL